MQYYIASGLENAAAVKDLKTILDEVGWHHTYDWTVHGRVVHEMRPPIADKEIEGVLQADVIIVLLPGGRGTHAELGMALAAVKLDAVPGESRIILYSADPEKDFGANSPSTCVFYHHPLVERFSSMDEMINSLLGAH